MKSASHTYVWCMPFTKTAFAFIGKVNHLFNIRRGNGADAATVTSAYLKDDDLSYHLCSKKYKYLYSKISVKLIIMF